MHTDNLRRAKVLIVEDSRTQAMRLRSLLEKAGLEVSLAQNGRVGLEVARGMLPDLIVLDVHMPEMNGIQVCRALKRLPETQSIPIIMLTAHDDLETFSRSFELGVVDFIPKDEHADDTLLKTLEQLGILF
jgi:CheY-like chemotaxis protein